LDIFFKEEKMEEERRKKKMGGDIHPTPIPGFQNATGPPPLS